MQSRKFEIDPFDLKHKNKYNYHCRSRDIVYEQIKAKVLAGQGVLSVSGEVGIGKTFLLQQLKADLSGEVTFIHLPSLDQTFQSLITELCEDLGLSSGKEIILVALQSIYKFLEEQRNSHPRIVVMIDNAHQLQAGVFDKLLLLSVPPSYKSSSLQLIFSGTPGFDTRMNEGKHSRNLSKQFFSYELDRLDSSDTLGFINHLLGSQDNDKIHFFTPGAIANIVDFSSGVPGRIKTICDTALSAIGYPESPGVTEKLISYVVQELLIIPQEVLIHGLPDPEQQIENMQSKDAARLTTEYMLSIAQAEVCDNTQLNEEKGQIQRSSLYDVNSELNIRSEEQLDGDSEKVKIKRLKTRLGRDMGAESSVPISWGVTALLNKRSEVLLNDNLEAEKINRNKTGMERDMSAEPNLPLSWGVAALVVICAIIFAYQTFMPVPDNPPILTVEEDQSVSNELLPIDDAEQVNLRDKSFEIIASNSGQPTMKSALTPPTEQVLDSDKPGHIARVFIADFERSGHSASLDAMFSRAQMLNEQNLQTDSYLLVFYAAKKGHGDAAFLLAQMSDPATFSKTNTIFTQANVTQANKWYMLAVQAGHPRAKDFLKQMRKRVINKANDGDQEAYRQALQFRNGKF